MTVFNIARREILVGNVFKHSALKHVNTGGSKTLVKRFKKTHIVLHVRKRL